MDRSLEGHRRTLTFCRALVALTVRENAAAMTTIAAAFARAASVIDQVSTIPDVPASGSPGLEASCARLGDALRDGITAVQMHDITDQRLSHVMALLGALGEGREPMMTSLLSDAGERALLDAIDDGLSVEEACARIASTDTARGGVELF